ncbi:phage tail protein [Lactobacillus mulieris]|uniref:Phage tail protein n=1 Tax=Lactobacillus mulieris TaxID=2508708 RepID=A0AAP3GWH8_9LACO|nr:phage tail protein [Lactobacillus mulieris]MCZ3844170.1 phage tail protein [Lactobacillus mulieris]MCZ3875830.1 phage tail protein [Lactobacillus mulieris]
MLANKLIVKNKSSTDYGVFIQYPFTLVNTLPEITAVQIPGHSGDLLTNNTRFQNVTQTLNLYIEKPQEYETWSSLSMAIQDWLYSFDYQPIIISSLNDYYLEGYMSQAPVITPQDDMVATGSVAFNCKPYLKRIDDIDFRSVPSTVIGIETINAKPIFHIKGSGVLTLTVNGQKYVLNGVDDEIFIDGEKEWIYKHDLNQNRMPLAQFPNNDFPELVPGKNTISLSGKYSLFEYKPNWRRLI